MVRRWWRINFDRFEFIWIGYGQYVCARVRAWCVASGSERANFTYQLGIFIHNMLLHICIICGISSSEQYLRLFMCMPNAHTPYVQNTNTIRMEEEYKKKRSSLIVHYYYYLPICAVVFISIYLYWKERRRETHGSTVALHRKRGNSATWNILDIVIKSSSAAEAAKSFIYFFIFFFNSRFHISYAPPVAGNMDSLR